jgi:hypothetical protein
MATSAGHGISMHDSPSPQARRLPPILALLSLGLSLLNSVLYLPEGIGSWCLTCAMEAAMPSLITLWVSTLGACIAYAAARESKSPMFLPRVGLAVVIGNDLLRWFGLELLANWMLSLGWM